MSNLVIFTNPRELLLSQNMVECRETKEKEALSMKPIHERPFTDRALLRLLIPLMIEQTLAVTVGLADSLMVASLGESAVSAVSLVDTVNVLLTNLFGSLATGGAIVTGQYLGRRAMKEAQRSAEQLVIFVGLLAVLITAAMYVLRDTVIFSLFGRVEAEVSSNCLIYYNIVELSIPFLAVYSAGASLFCIMGKSSVSMWVSLAMNLINICGNATLVYGLHWDVSGVALPTLLSRIFAAVAILLLLRNQSLAVHLSKKFRISWDRAMVRQIVRTGVPNGIEGSMFQLGKILLMSMISTFGTTVIAANAIGNTLMTFMNLPSNSTGGAITTVISQCVGQRDYDSAQYYTKKLMRFASLSLIVSNGLIMLLLPFILNIYSVSAETRELAYWLIASYSIACVLIWSFSFTFPQTLRAAGDTKFVMCVSVASMWLFRLVLGVLLATRTTLGIKGVWLAMYVDWAVRSLCFLLRYRSGRWKTKAIS